MNRFVLCADDFALTDNVSRAILTLLDEQRLSATGAMTNRPGWGQWGRELAGFAGRADLGLHLNLTCGAPLGAMPVLAPDGRLPPLRRLIGLALSNDAARIEIVEETLRQIDAFMQVMSAAPDFIDGHQHVHAMPGVRGAVLTAVAGEPNLKGVYVRDPADRLGAIRARGVAPAKAAVIAMLASGFGARVEALGFRINQGFSGVSPFDPGRDFEADLDRFISHPGPRHLVMCHPGLADDAELAGLDPVVASRPVEFAALRRWVPGRDAERARYRELGLT